MNKILVFLTFFIITLLGCKDQKKGSSEKEIPEKAKVELQKVEESINEISNEVEEKSKALDDALDAL